MRFKIYLQHSDGHEFLSAHSGETEFESREEAEKYRYAAPLAHIEECPKRLYIAGPMTGIRMFNFPAFDSAAHALRARGYDVVSPAELDDEVTRRKALASPDGAVDGEAFSQSDYAGFLARDVEIVMGCDGIVLLDGWETSKGARLELAAAQLFGLTVYQFDRDDNGDQTLVTANEVGVTWRSGPPPEDLPEELGGDPKTILAEALELVNGARQKQYGHPIDDFSRTALIWEAILGVKVPVEKVPLCMAGVKISRAVESPEKRDSIVDLAGYAATYEMVKDRQGKPLR